MEDTIYSLNNSNMSDILMHLEICNESFNPPLSQRVDLIKYANKLFKKAINLEAWDLKKERLTGLISVYVNGEDIKKAYITNVSISPNYYRRGIAKKLMYNFFEIAKQKGVEEIQLEVHSQSISAIKLYFDCGFQISDKSNEIIKMEKKLI